MREKPSEYIWYVCTGCSKSNSLPSLQSLKTRKSGLRNLPCLAKHLSFMAVLTLIQVTCVTFDCIPFCTFFSCDWFDIFVVRAYEYVKKDIGSCRWLILAKERYIRRFFMIAWLFIVKITSTLRFTKFCAMVDLLQKNDVDNGLSW